MFLMNPFLMRQFCSINIKHFHMIGREKHLPREIVNIIVTPSAFWHQTRTSHWPLPFAEAVTDLLRRALARAFTHLEGSVRLPYAIRAFFLAGFRRKLLRFLLIRSQSSGRLHVSDIQPLPLKLKHVDFFGMIYLGFMSGLVSGI